MISIISKALGWILLVILVLYIIPTLAYLAIILYFLIVFFTAFVASKIVPKAKRETAVGKIVAVMLMNPDRFYSTGFNLGKWINALQRDWLPKLSGGERIANLIIASSRKTMPKFELFIKAFVNGMKTRKNLGDGKSEQLIQNEGKKTDDSL